MDRLEAMRLFTAVAELQSFSEAARRSGVSAPVVTRAVASLEARLGTTLLVRTTRRVRLTEAGARYAAESRRLLADVEEVEAALVHREQALRGELAVTASALFGRLFVAPLLLAFLRQNPEVTGNAWFTDRVVDLVEEGLDVAIRIARLPDSSLTAARVGAVRRVVCASPAFLARHGRPRSPADLERFPAIAFSQDRTAPAWSFERDGRAFSVRPKTQLVVSSTDVAIEAALQDHGLTRVLSYMVGRELADGRLEPVLEAYEPEPVPVHVVHAGGRRAPARVRAFVDHAVATLRAEPFIQGNQRVKHRAQRARSRRK